MGVAIGSGNQGAAREYWSTGSVIVLPLVALLAIAFIAVSIIWAPDWFKVSEANVSTLQWAMLAGGVGLFFSYYGQMWYVLAATQLDFRFISVIRSVLALVSTIGSLAVAIFSRNAAWLVAFSSLISAIQFCVLMHRANTRYQMPVQIKDFRRARLFEMLPYTGKTFATLISGSLLGSLDRIMLGRLAPAADFAAFNVSLNIGSRVQNLSQAAMGPIFCNATRGVGGDSSRAPRMIYRNSFDFLFPWYGAFLVWLVAWQTPLLSIWLGSNASTVEMSFIWIVAGSCLAALGNLSGAQLGPIDRVGTGLIFSIAVSLSSVAFVVGGWFFGGLTGAAIGFFAARLLLILQDHFVRRFIGLGYGRADVVNLCTVGAAILVCALARCSLIWLGESTQIVLFLALLSGAVSAAVIAFSNSKSSKAF
jgi:O-antigen/teichoic acid export membrane protein